MLDSTPITPEHALQQDPAFFDALKYCGQTPVSLPNGMTLLSRRFLGVRIAMLPRATPPPDLEAQLKQVGLGRVPLILSPEKPCFDMKGCQVRSGISMARIDLSGDTAMRRARLHSKWRNQLCRAESGPLRTKSEPLTPDHPILQQEEQQALARRYANWPRVLTSAFAHVAQDQTRLFTALLNGKPVAQMLFLRHENRATYHIGQTSTWGRTYNAHNLLLWRASCWLADLGHTSLDLGPLPAETPSLNRFKLRAGAEAHLTGGTWVQWRPFS